MREGDYTATGIRVGSVWLRVHFKGVCQGGMNNTECSVQLVIWGRKNAQGCKEDQISKKRENTLIPFDLKFENCCP